MELEGKVSKIEKIVLTVLVATCLTILILIALLNCSKASASPPPLWVHDDYIEYNGSAVEYPPTDWAVVSVGVHSDTLYASHMDGSWWEWQDGVWVETKEGRW